ncbi:hypothetical protein [Ensifer sp. LC163]|uniref:hypothetical protein n=1 Tax=Ensifer sp. LC163 TaxID=1120652 RepID=UPI0008137EC9|nr:hypothetical protein [Ensifer sp. LC163]OCP38621.1 hypothetical protein BC360_00675 [Ensifer sp. LC163]
MNSLYATDELQSATKRVSDTFLSPNKSLAHLDRRQNAAGDAMKLSNYETDTLYDHRPSRTPIPGRVRDTTL